MSSPIKAKRKVVFTKVETTYGTDAVPVAGTDAMLTHDWSCSPLNQRLVDYDPALPYFGNGGMIPVGATMTMQYSVDMCGAGGVDTVAKFGPALRGCALSQTVTPTVGPVTYAPITSGEEAVTKYFYWDGLLHKLLGGRGNVEFMMSAGGIPRKRFTFEGLYGGVTDVALPTPTLTGWQRPQAVNLANTTVALHGYSALLRELSINLGNVMNYVNLPNSESIRFVDRKVRGSITIGVPLIATKDFFTICRNATLGALAITHGTTAGNRAIISASNVQLTNPQYSEAEGMAFMQMGMELQPTTAGNNEFSYATQ